MPNRQLTKQELETLAYPLLADVRASLESLSKGDKDLLWALRRKVTKELGFDERGKTMYRVALKKKRRKAQNDLCANCSNKLPERGSVLDRLKAMDGYTVENTRVLCPECDSAIQKERKFA